MKNTWLVISFLLGTLQACAEDVPSSLGARTEALCIIQNKMHEVKEYSSSLKKKLTEYHVQQNLPQQRLPRQQLTEQLQPRQLQPQRYKNWADRQYSHYQMGIRDLIFPASIRELECLVGHLEKEAALLSQESVTNSEIQRVVDLATFLKKKIDFESHLLELLFALDTEEAKIQDKHKRDANKRNKKALHRGSDSAKKAVDQVKMIVAQTNDRLYSEMNCPGNRLYLDKLTLYNHR